MTDKELLFWAKRWGLMLLLYGDNDWLWNMYYPASSNIYGIGEQLIAEHWGLA